MNRRLGLLLLAACWFAWGFSYPATKFALATLDPWTLRSLATLGGGVALLLVALAQGLSLQVRREHWRDLVIAALFNMTIFQLGMTFGVQLLSAGRTAVIVYTMPLWAGLLAVPLLGERLSARNIAALVLGLSGLAVLLSQDFSHLRNGPLGAAITLGAAVSFGLGTVWMKRRQWNTDPTVLGAWQLLLGAVPVVLLTLVLAPPFSAAAVSHESWLALAYLIVIANALAYFAWFRVVAMFPAVVSGIGAMAVPVVGIFASAVLVDEQIGWRELVALLLICGAIAINLFTRRPPGPVAPKP